MVDLNLFHLKKLIWPFFLVISMLNDIQCIDTCTIDLVAFNKPNQQNKQSVSIIKDGIISESWREDEDVKYPTVTVNEDNESKNSSGGAYVASKDIDIEYFYLTYYHPSLNTTQDDVTISLITNDTINSDPKAETVKDKMNLEAHFKKRAIELVYNCKGSAHKTIALTMKIKVLACDKDFTIHWHKICIPRDHSPSINIGLTSKFNDVMESGTFKKKSIRLDGETDEKFILPMEASSFSFYLSYAKPHKTLMMKPPTIIVDQTDLQVFPSGRLSKGGLLTNKPEFLEINFICTPYKITKSDVQISLEFENFDTINLFFTKQCDTIAEIKEYFTILYTIYWILLFLIVVFLIAIIMYYLKKTNTTLGEVWERFTNHVRSILNKSRLETTNEGEDHSHEKIPLSNTSSNNNEKQHSKSNNNQRNYTNLTDLENEQTTEKDLIDESIVLGGKKNNSYGAI